MIRLPSRQLVVRSLVSRATICCLMVSALALSLHSRLRFIGPNPYYSFRSFPQDIRLFKSPSSIFYLYYQGRGWMGNLDVPEISPSPNYIATEEFVQENYSGSQTAEAGFKGSWTSPEFLAVPLIIDFKSFRFIPIVSGRLDMFSLNASGQAISYGSEGSSIVPFSSSLSQKNLGGSLGFLMSTTIKGAPVGLMFNYTHSSESRPKGSLNYTKQGIENHLNRYNWGWSTVSGCNHIFGDPTNIDAFWQDHYFQTSQSKYDVVIGTNIGDNKLGFRFRKTIENGDAFAYSESENRYLKSSRGSKTTNTMLRASDVVKIMNIGEAKLYLVGVLEVDFIRQRDIKEDVELLDSFRENVYVVEFLPFVHFDLDRGGFFRLGTSASFFWRNYSYEDIWGDQQVYSHGWAYYNWEKSWERSSYGNGFTFINFTEANLEVSLYQKWDLLLSLDVWSHLVFSRTKRYYGHTVSNNDSLSFEQSAERKNKLREVWFGGTAGLMVGRRVSYGLFVDLPIYYDPFLSTNISGVEGVFSGKSNPQPSFRKPVSFWAMVIVRW